MYNMENMTNEELIAGAREQKKWIDDGDSDFDAWERLANFAVELALRLEDWDEPQVGRVRSSTRVAMNSSGEQIRVGMLVERIDNYKRGGRVIAINHERGGCPVLVRWAGPDDQWMEPGILYERGTFL